MRCSNRGYLWEYGGGSPFCAMCPRYLRKVSIARSTGYKYCRGDWLYDDTMLHTTGIHRLGNVLMPVENYGLAVEKFARRLFLIYSIYNYSWMT